MNFVNRSWVEIDLKQLRKNLSIYKVELKDSISVMAVVKANAYGHGDVEVAKVLQEEGVKHFAVSNIIEAINLRNNGIVGDILILGYTPVNQSKNLKKYGITQAILSNEYAKQLANQNLKIKVQFAIDTGMNRIGLSSENVASTVNIIRSYSNVFNIKGLFTHLCVADCEQQKEFTNIQIDRFKRVVNEVSDLNLSYVHCLNSAGGLWHEKYGNICRLGIILYGCKPDYSNKLPRGIKPCIKWKSVISMVKKVKKGETIGYGRSYEAPNDRLIATISTGYADGYNRLLSNIGAVYIKDCKCPIVGRICMDQFMVDVTNCPNVSLGDEVELLNEKYNADEMANEIGTIGYEVLCNISERVSRIYKR